LLTKIELNEQFNEYRNAASTAGVLAINKHLPLLRSRLRITNVLDGGFCWVITYCSEELFEEESYGKG
jgi:hypothetical protein